MIRSPLLMPAWQHPSSDHNPAGLTDSSMSSYFCEAATPMPLRCSDDIHSSVRMLRGAPSNTDLPTCSVTVFSSSSSLARWLLLPIAAKLLQGRPRSY